MIDLDYKTVRYLGHQYLMTFLLHGLRLQDRRPLLKELMESAIPCTHQDVVLAFCTVTGWRNGRYEQEADARKIYYGKIHGVPASSIQITTATSICAVLDLFRLGKLPTRGFVRQEDVPLAEFITNEFGAPYECATPNARANRRGESPGGTRMKLPTQILPAARNGVWNGLAISGGADVPWGSAELSPRSPIDGAVTSQIATADSAAVKLAVDHAGQAFTAWRTIPAPKRGHLVRRIGELVRERLEPLAELVTLEAGKIPAEARGEIQEWIDICEFAVGLSRQLHGLTIASERPEHHLLEQWHPLGPVGVISAFNFPAAVWAWNAMLGFVCGDPIVWKPSEQTPLIALACHQVVCDAAKDVGFDVPTGLSSVVIGGPAAGAALAADARLPLISATGSVAMGKKVAAVVGARLGKSLLELGGNNGMIVMPTADLDLAVRAIVFAAVGTCGQRCTEFAPALRASFAGRKTHHQAFVRILLAADWRSPQAWRAGRPAGERTSVRPFRAEHRRRHRPRR